MNAPLPKTPLDPDSIRYWTVIKTGRREIYCATSADGVWRYWHNEDAGTTWAIAHRDHPGVIDYMPSLDACREATASPWALQELTRPPRDISSGCQYRSPFRGPITSCLHSPRPGDTLCSMHRVAADLAAPQGATA